MRSGFSLREMLLGSGLIVLLTVALLVVALLAAVGLFLEVNGARTVVVTQRPTTLAASHVEANPLDQSASEVRDAAADDPTADTGGEHAETLVERAGAQSSPVARSAQEATPGPAPESAPDPSPDVVAEEPPKPELPAAQVRPTLAAPGPPRATADLPIVMYHHVGPLPPNPDIYRRDLTVSPDTFARTLDRLADQGVETVTMAELFEHFAGGAELPKRSVVLTFDDGYDDCYEFAFQALKARGMVGTFFISTDFVDRPGYMTWGQVEEMANAGMEIAAHSANHADFTRISPNELRRQLVEPKAILEEHIGQPVRFMAYPAGKYNAAVMAATKADHYAAVTVLHGTRHVPSLAFELRRVRARGADSVTEIVTRMSPATWRQ